MVRHVGGDAVDRRHILADVGDRHVLVVFTTPALAFIALTMVSKFLVSILVPRKISEKMFFRCEALGSATGNFLGMRRRMASSMSWMRFVAPRIQMRCGVLLPAADEEARPSQCVMNLSRNVSRRRHRWQHVEPLTRP